MSELNLSAEETKELKQLQNRINELKKKSRTNTKDLKDRFAKIMKFKERPKHMRIKKWEQLRKDNAKPMHIKLKYAEWKYSRKFRVSIESKNSIELQHITHKFVVKNDEEQLTFQSPYEVYKYLGDLPGKYHLGLDVYVYPLADNKHMYNKAGEQIGYVYSYVGFSYPSPLDIKFK